MMLMIDGWLSQLATALFEAFDTVLPLLSGLVAMAVMSAWSGARRPGSRRR